MRLHLGCGLRVHPDWANVDLHAYEPSVRVLDLTRPLPFPDASSAVVYHAHVLEHLRREQAPAFLAECRPVLRPGGILRGVVPDLEGWCRAYLQALEAVDAERPGAAAKHEFLLIELLDALVREEQGGALADWLTQLDLPNLPFVRCRLGSEVDAYRALRAGRRPSPRAYDTARPTSGRRERRRLRRLGRLLNGAERRALERARFRESGEPHRWMYDRVSRRRLLQDAGFAAVRVCEAGESAVPGWRAYGFEHDASGTERRADSLYVEAARPGA